MSYGRFGHTFCQNTHHLISSLADDLSGQSAVSWLTIDQSDEPGGVKPSAVHNGVLALHTLT